MNVYLLLCVLSVFSLINKSDVLRLLHEISKKTLKEMAIATHTEINKRVIKLQSRTINIILLTIYSV